MATAYWRGKNGTVQQPGSGQFNVAANWLNGRVPDRDTRVILGGGLYTVTSNAAGQEQEMRSITIGETVQLKLSGQSGNTALSVLEDSVNFGMVFLDRGRLNLTADAAFANYGSLVSGSQTFSFVVGGRVFDNFGRVSTVAPRSSLWFTDVAVNHAGGTISADQQGLIALTGTFTNDGLVEARGGSTITLVQEGAAGTATNFADNALRGGQWLVADNSTIRLAGGGAVASVLDGAQVTLGGDGMLEARQTDGTMIGLERSLRLIGVGAALHLTEGSGFFADQVLELRGKLTLDGSTLTTEELAAYRDSEIAGVGTINARTLLSGIVTVVPTAASRTLTFVGDGEIDGTLAGRGEIAFVGGAFALGANARLGVSELSIEAGSLRIPGSLTFNGIFSMTDGQLQTFGDELRLRRAAQFENVEISGGPASIVVMAGGGSLAGLVTIGVDFETGRKIDIEGTAIFERQVSGRGQYSLGDDATLVFHADVRAEQSIVLKGENATLDLENPFVFRARILQFGASDSIDLAGIDADSRVRWRPDEDGVGGRLDIFDDKGRVSLRFNDGLYEERGFSLHDTGEGAAVLTYAIDTSSAAYPLALTSPSSMMAVEFSF